MRRLFRVLPVAILLAGALPSAYGQTNDYLIPPGPPGSEETRMKTMNQVEPRTLISALPFVITNSGSYYVTGTLQSTNAAHGITVMTNYVRIDLNGFALIGRQGILARNGINVAGGPYNGLTIRNGVICNWGAFGIMATGCTDVVLEDVKSFGNNCGGLYVGENSLLDRCSAYGNGSYVPSGVPLEPPPTDGIQVGAFSTVNECKARKNKGAGIHTYFHCKVTGCTATESQDANGIWGENYCTIRDCTVSQNKMHGIRVASKCRVVGNTCGENGIQDPSTNAAGICIEGNNTLIENNNLVGNDFGIYFSPGAQGNLVVRNTASKNQIDYFTQPNNYMGPVESFMSGMFTNANPWANFKFSTY